MVVRAEMEVAPLADETDSALVAWTFIWRHVCQRPIYVCRRRRGLEGGGAPTSKPCTPSAKRGRFIEEGDLADATLGEPAAALRPSKLPAVNKVVPAVVAVVALAAGRSCSDVS